MILHHVATILADQGVSCPAYHLCKEDYLQTQFSPAHLLSELGFTVLFDLLLVWLLWGKFLKRRFIKTVHRQIDAEHNYTHEETHATTKTTRPKSRAT